MSVTYMTESGVEAASAEIAMQVHFEIVDDQQLRMAAIRRREAILGRPLTIDERFPYVADFSLCVAELLTDIVLEVKLPGIETTLAVGMPLHEVVKDVEMMAISRAREAGLLLA